MILETLITSSIIYFEKSIEECIRKVEQDFTFAERKVFTRVFCQNTGTTCIQFQMPMF